MDSVFLDTDVCLDILTFRKPFHDTSRELLFYFKRVEYKRVISESSIPTIIYILNERYKIPDGNERLIEWIESCEVVSAGKNSLLQALDSSFKDKEDACQYYTAINNDVDYFLTRNTKDYTLYTSVLPVYTPSDFLVFMQ